MRKKIEVSKIFIYLLITWCFGPFIFPKVVQSSSGPEFKPDRVAWTDLSFHAKNFWVEVATDIQMKSHRAPNFDEELIASPKMIPVKPKAPQVYEIKINTTIDPRFRSPVRILNRIWFNPTDASALGRIRLRRGEDDFKKIYRFTDRGVFRHRLEPRDKKEAREKPERWTDVKDSFYPYDLNRLGCHMATERSLLIYILSAAELSKINDSGTLCVFGKRQLHRVKLQLAGIHPIQVNFMEKTKTKEIRKYESIKAIKVAMTAEPMDSDLDETENFSFLGLHKDISIYIDPASHLPVQVSGVISTVGRVILNLRDVRLKD